MDAQTVLVNVREIAESFAAQRAERQQLRSLDLGDFNRLREAGFLLTGVPAAEGGLWQSAAHSTRGICEALAYSRAGRLVCGARFIDASGSARVLARVAEGRGWRPAGVGRPAR